MIINLTARIERLERIRRLCAAARSAGDWRTGAKRKKPMTPEPLYRQSLGQRRPGPTFYPPAVPAPRGAQMQNLIPIRPEREEKHSKGKETVGFVPFGLQPKMPRYKNDPPHSTPEYSPAHLYFTCSLQAQDPYDPTERSLRGCSYAVYTTIGIR